MSKIGNVILTLEEHGYDYNRLGNESFTRYDMVCRSSGSQPTGSVTDIRQRTIEADVRYCRWLGRPQYNLLRQSRLKELLEG